MATSCGIVGLPNVGKSTIFNALTSAHAAASNFPFCTIDPNTGIVKVPDFRLEKINELIPAEKIVPAAMTFIDIAGIVKGASKGEGLGNKFLSHIRETSAIAHVVRCFKDPGVIHVDGSVDPIRDVSTIETELIMADLETVVKRYSEIEKRARSGEKDYVLLHAALAKVRAGLESGKPARAVGLTHEEEGNIRDYHLLTLKKVLYIANVSEDEVRGEPAGPGYQALLAHAKSEGAMVVALCGKIEAEISELSDGEKATFLKEYGMEEPGLIRVIRAGFELLGLQTFFTAGDKENRAWTIGKGWKAPQAAGVIHTDFEKGFIKAEIYSYDDLMKYRTEAALREAGKMRMEGKEYVMRDGDIVHFRFNV